MRIDDIAKIVEQDGFVLLPSVYPSGRVEAILGPLEESLSRHATGVLGREGTVYAARNVLAIWPSARDIWRQAPLPEVLSHIMGPAFGLVRALYFDKPPGRSWALPWHKDLTIAVKDNVINDRRFSHPTTKAGVPHLKAPRGACDHVDTAHPP